MKVHKKVVLDDEEYEIFNQFTIILAELKAMLMNEDMNELYDDIDRLEKQVRDIWDDFDNE